MQFIHDACMNGCGSPKSPAWGLARIFGFDIEPIQSNWSGGQSTKQPKPSEKHRKKKEKKIHKHGRVEWKTKNKNKTKATVSILRESLAATDRLSPPEGSLEQSQPPFTSSLWSLLEYSRQHPTSSLISSFVLTRRLLPQWRTTRGSRSSEKVLLTLTPRRVSPPSAMSSLFTSYSPRVRHLWRRLQSARTQSSEPNRRAEKDPPRRYRRGRSQHRHPRNFPAQGNARSQRRSPAQHRLCRK